MNLTAKMKSDFKHMGNIIAIVAGLLMVVVGNTLDGWVGTAVRYLSGPVVQAPAPAPVPDLDVSKTEGSSAMTRLPPKRPDSARDWVDITDKLVDWFTKIVGSLTTLFGVVGLTRPKGEPAKSVILLPDDLKR